MVQAMMAGKAVEGIAKNKATPYIIGGVVLVGLGITYFGLIRPLFCFTGVLDCKADKMGRSVMNHNGFDPNYGVPSKTTMTHDRAKVLADKIYEAGGSFNDKEGDFYSAMQEAGSSHNLSLISRMFSVKYNESMGEYITNYLDEKDELDKIDNILNKYK